MEALAALIIKAKRAAWAARKEDRESLFQNTDLEFQLGFDLILQFQFHCF